MTEVPEQEALRLEIENLRSQLRAAEHEVLTSRDYAIGLEAETSRLRGEAQTADAERAQALDDLQNARRELESIRTSISWRVGNILVRPFSAAKRSLRNR